MGEEKITRSAGSLSTSPAGSDAPAPHVIVTRTHTTLMGLPARTASASTSDTVAAHVVIRTSSIATIAPGTATCAVDRQHALVAVLERVNEIEAALTEVLLDPC
jgi:hypothetical protein